VVALVRDVERGRSVDGDVAAAKLYLARVANDITDDAMQILGARAYTPTFPVERWWRDGRLARIGGGSDEVLREVIAARLDVADGAMDRWLDEIERDNDLPT
jgi:alkylation response protein AidB-like acyl-CoA dehydrogenase